MQSRLAWLLQATDALPRDAGMDSARTVHAFAIAAATAAPSAQLLNKRCPAADQVSSQVLQCRQLATLMADSPTLITALIGIAIMRRQALDPEQVAEWNARYRQLQWLAQATAPWVDVTTGHAQQVARYGEVPTLLRLLRVLARRLRRTNNNLADLIFTDVPGRVAKQLLQLAQRFGTQEGGALRVTHDLTQEEIAQLVGASRETVNKALADFAQRGWLRLEGKSVLIADSERLARRAR